MIIITITTLYREKGSICQDPCPHVHVHIQMFHPIEAMQYTYYVYFYAYMDSAFCTSMRM